MHMHTHMHTYTYTCIQVNIDMHTCTQVNMFMHTHTCTYMYMQTCTCARVHTHTHTYTHPDASFRSVLYMLRNGKLLLSALHEGHSPCLLNSVWAEQSTNEFSVGKTGSVSRLHLMPPGLLLTSVRTLSSSEMLAAHVSCWAFSLTHMPLVTMQKQWQFRTHRWHV